MGVSNDNLAIGYGFLMKAFFSRCRLTRIIP
jgi:hypothetical protein